MRRPLLHFTALGALLFALMRFSAGAAPTAPLVQSLQFSDEEVLYRAALRFGIDRDDPVVQGRLIRNMRFLDSSDGAAVALYRDAMQLGMPESDLVVRRRLVERMRLLLQEPALAAEPSDAELRAYLEAHRESFEVPATVRLRQVFLDPRRRRSRLKADAARLLERLQRGQEPDDTALGDPLPLPAQLTAASQQEVERLFGAELAATAFSSASGRWVGPLRSAYGMHLVLVQERAAAQPAALDSVRAQLRAAVREERAERALRDGLRVLRRGESPFAGAEQQG